MSDAGEELNEFATELERHALKLPRPLAAMVLAVAAARIAGDAPEAELAETRSVCRWNSVLAHHKRGWDGTMAGYGHETGAAVNPANSTNPEEATMGEAAKDMLDGTVCEGCGEFFDDIINGGEPPGFPRRCTSCKPPRKPKPRKRQRKSR